VTIRISILNGPDKGTQTQLDGDAVIGRSQEADLCLKEGTVSRQHARMVSSDKGTILEKISDKGVLKCDGKSVKKVILKHRQRVQCGAILMLVEDLSKKSVPKSVPSGRMLPVQEDGGLPEKLDQQLQGEGFDQEQTQVIGYVDEKPQQEEADLESARKFSPKRLVQVAALILLVFMGWQVFSNLEDPPVPQLVFPYRAGEEKLIDLSAYYKRYRVRSPSGLSIDRGDLVRAQLDPFSILNFKTLKQGDAVLSLLDSNGKSQLDLKLMIRGKVEATAQSIDFQLLPEEQKLDRARTLMDQGRLVSRDNAYQAFLHYRQALDILESVSTTHPLYLQCRKDMKAPKRAFEGRLERLWEEADRHRKNKTYDRALVLVDEILSMVGDTSQLDYQRAQIYRKHIVQRLPK
jgi:pSer/pThr/pTyr-binding forkhead associated (FHA) protein